jgi:hypothetical protein
MGIGKTVNLLRRKLTRKPFKGGRKTRVFPREVAVPPLGAEARLPEAEAVEAEAVAASDIPSLQEIAGHG